MSSVNNLEELEFVNSVMVLSPEMETTNYWLFDVYWKYKEFHIYSCISGYGQKINHLNFCPLIKIHIEQSINQELLLESQRLRIIEKTKRELIKTSLALNINVNFNECLLSY